MNLSTSDFRLELRPVRRADEEDWCRVQVLAQASGFEANFEAWLQTVDLERFAKEVQCLHAEVGIPGIATLKSAEPDIEVTLAMRMLGGVDGSYKLRNEQQTGGATTLTGAFEADQSLLPALHESVLSLLAELRNAHAA